MNKRLDEKQMNEFRLSNVAKQFSKDPLIQKVIRFLLRNGQKVLPSMLLDSFDKKPAHEWIKLDEFCRDDNRRLIDLCPDTNLDKYSGLASNLACTHQA